MRYIFTILVLTLSIVAFKAHASDEKRIERKDLSKIKVLSSSTDKVHLFLKSTLNKETYRISFLNDHDANLILNRLKSNEALILKTEPVLNKTYLDVISWQ